MHDALHLLIAYDGSEQATAAINFAATLFAPSARATILYAWEPIAMYPSLGVGPIPIPPDAEDRAETGAETVVETGARHARSLGLVAEGRAEATLSSPWRTIVDAAERDAADLIVIGTRGLSGVRSLLLGSCSHLVAQHALCPVLIVPDDAIRDARRSSAGANGRVAH
jgi:nucleotide-binding universal stress UspA family protein